MTILIGLLFVLGYILIILEHKIGINKATIALLMAVGCWMLLLMDIHTREGYLKILYEHLANVSQVVFFLMGALTVVEIINVHGGLKFICRIISRTSKLGLLWATGFLTFFLSAIIDNLTSTIVMVFALRKLPLTTKERHLLGGAIVIAANAGGAWTPIGDVTTTMLWMGQQVTTFPLIKHLFLPSFLGLITALIWFSFLLRGKAELETSAVEDSIAPHGKLIFLIGTLSMVFVPIFKMLTGLPPFMGVLLAMGFLWLATDILHRHDTARDHLRLPSVLPQIDFSSILFFLGILLSVNALEAAGHLDKLAIVIDRFISSKHVIAIVIGIISAIIDNVPLVAACQGMYSLETYCADSPFWELVALCTGTGGSLLLIGSAAGIALMGLEKVDFFWYLRYIMAPAATSYTVSIIVYRLLTVYF